MVFVARRLGLLSFGLTLGAAGCYDDHHHCDYQCDGYYDDGSYDGSSGGNGTVPGCISGVGSGSIDAGSFLELQDPGYAAGVSAEYFGGGKWRFAFACDTANPSSGLACNYDMTVSPVDGDIQSFAPESLEASDSLRNVRGTTGRSGINLVATTDYDVDAFTLDVTPGSTLEVNLTLDGQCASPFMFWSENGQIVSDGHTLIDLTPSAP